MMRMPLSKIALAACLLCTALVPAVAATRAGAALQKRRTARPAQRRKPRLREPDVIFVPTPSETVDEMLRQARLKKGDVLFDLGSGDIYPLFPACEQVRRGAGGGAPH